ncbi:ribosomal protein S18-alanine N-acetyltransferase [Pelagirhabdus alkalitolerans]|nr:ribosomal protein S18-alanine N-acetyltransferase [Pelagirhabdus alkalitolerans]
MSQPIIRDMDRKDIDAVEMIERETFSTPWSREIYLKEIEENKFAYYFVIEEDQEIVGFCGVWFVFDDAQITNLAIDKRHRNKGYGKMLFQYVLNRAIARGIHQLSLEVRESNETAQSLYKKFGLQPAGIRKQYYTDNQEDAIVMWVKL